ncbi:WXG100 family type VII secretion target [Schaalia sp. ZJ405]|uniref:WXG100 family type VII secretion target n=1 Tax=unclassified Schaalia TaxID=2691889 RepID=UPI0013EA3903|nr:MULTISPECIES: WXG100 family type VII secretion target [unclassified Schaalia]QPK81043.1 WXG100 family type VII secretion target [Schaalia sp. ZJ405]
MATFMVDSQLVASSATNVSLTAERIRQEVQTMLAQLLELESSWTGVAQMNFQDCVAQWQATQAQVDAALESISTQMHTAASVYADAEAQSAALFAG